MPFLTTAWNFLGIKGVAILILAAFIGFQWIEIKSLRHDVTDLQETIGKKNMEIGSLKAAIEEQNKAIDAAAKEQAAAQDSLRKAQIARDKMRKEYEKQIGALINRPLPIDCVAAVTELKSENMKNARAWNK